jgi:hypothetical protein
LKAPTNLFSKAQFPRYGENAQEKRAYCILQNLIQANHPYVSRNNSSYSNNITKRDKNKPFWNETGKNI